MKDIKRKFSNETNIVAYKEPMVDFEVNSFIEKTVDLILIPVLNSLPASFQKFVKKSHVSAKRVIDNKTTHKALEILYNNGESFGESRTFKERIFHKVWFSTNNSKGVRNRLKIVRNEIRKKIEKLITEKKDIKILSIASGSARAVLEAIHDSNIPKSCNVSVTFLDKNQTALEYSKELCREFEIPSNYELRWVNDTASNFKKYFDKKKPNIIEMVGLLDYFTKEKTKDIFSIIKKNIDDDGMFIAANITDNSERKFITNLIGWDMDYKSPNDLLSIALYANFKPDNIIVYYEPLKVHSVIVIKK